MSREQVEREIADAMQRDCDDLNEPPTNPFNGLASMRVQLWVENIRASNYDQAPTEAPEDPRVTELLAACEANMREHSFDTRLLRAVEAFRKPVTR